MNENIVESPGIPGIPGIRGTLYPPEYWDTWDTRGYSTRDTKILIFHISIEYNYMNCNMDNYCDYDALSTSILEFVSDCPMKLQCKSRVDSLEFAMLFEFM